MRFSPMSGPVGSPTGSPTRGFLFADLRGYTDFVEARGATAAAELLDRYRALVRAAIAQFEGAEVKTEGDSFYVVFGYVSTAVRCALVIAQSAGRASSEHPDTPIRVGIGIHAGETVETTDGFVGSPVNIAARICAQARAGEVLVSDTVRALTQSILPLRFDSRGRRQLKGVTEPITLYAVVPTSAAATRRTRLLGDRRTIAAGLLLLGIGAVLAFLALRPAAGLPAGEWKIAVDLPLGDDLGGLGQPVRDAVRLALDEVNGRGGVGGKLLALAEYDMGDEITAESLFDQNARAQAADPWVVAVVGPWASPVAYTQIPIANEAGLLQCSPSATDPKLTKPRYGALNYRATFPDRINFIRLAPADDIQSVGMASFAFHDLAVKRVLVVDDTDELGRQVGDIFEEAFLRLGGTVVRRALNPDGDAGAVLAPLSDPTDRPAAVFFGGFTGTGAPALRTAMVAAGHGSVPFLSWEGIYDPAGAVEGSFIELAGPAAEGSYASRIAITPPRQDFVDRFRTAYGQEPPHEFVSAGYACTEVILQSLRAVAERRPGALELREMLRAHAVKTENRYETVLGTAGFDANGDSINQLVTFYRVEPSAAGGRGDWVVAKQQNFAPAP